MMQVPIDCFTEASLSINHNAESQSCHADAFGKNTKIMGAREATGSITMPWVDGTKYFETEYEVYMQNQKQMKSALRTSMQLLKIPYKEAQGNVKTITFPNRYSVDLEDKGGSVILFIQGSEPFIISLSSVNMTVLNRFFGRSR